MLAAARRFGARPLTRQPAPSAHKTSHLLATPAYARTLATSSSPSLSPNQEIHGFLVEDVTSVGELKLQAIRLRHQTTGAEWLHISRDDRNNVFSIGFNTSVSDSTGLPHILEHTTLCGSEKYPVRDPFFKMLNRSMATFMNAWTAHDYTQYPFATQNAQDYANLQNVYLDSVFHPLLREADFRQEGWRLERKHKGGAWGLKGVVYNEMKGAFSDPAALYATRAEQHLFAGSTYQHVSGGDPAYIPDLTHEQLVAFHRSRYHPSNARIYSYGSLPLEPQLARVSRVLSPYTHVTPPEAPPMDVSPLGERSVTEHGPIDASSDSARQTRFSLSYLANDLRSVYDTFAMRLYSGLLLDGTSAPMHRALIDSHLGSDYSANTGYSPYTRRTSLAVGLQGMREEDVALVEAKVKETFLGVHDHGFEPRRVEAALAAVELAYKHRTADFGLALMKSLTTGWFHGVDPVEYLRIGDHVARLRADSQHGGLFESLTARYFLNSRHTLRYTMLPDAEYSARLDQRERDMVDAKVAQLTPAQADELDAKNAALAAEQKRPTEDLSMLPTLHLSDVALETDRCALDMSVAGSAPPVPVQWRTTATNGISYLRLINNVHSQHPSLRPYLPLFCDALTYLGTHTRDMREIETDVRLHTGGITFAPFVTTDLANLRHIEAGVSFGSHCLDAHVPRMYELVGELLRETDFGNTDRLRALVAAQASAMFNDVAGAGHAYARRLAAATLSPEAHAQEAFAGLQQVRFLGELARTQDLGPAADQLRHVHSVVFNKPSLRAAITTNAGATDDNHRALEHHLLANYPVSRDPPAEQHPPKFMPTASRIFCPMPFATNYAAKATVGVAYTHPDSVKLQLLAKFLTPNYLHREIREINGAYGGGAGYSALQGIFSFFSYRDPAPLRSLDSFDKSVQWLLAHEITEREITEAKLSVFGDLDAPLSAADEGMAYFTAGITDDMRQERREMFRATTAEDLKDVAQRYLASPEAAAASSVAVIGEQSLAVPHDWTTFRLHTE
ncbi:Mitochondrial presequence protease [Coemansia interrupta]|uniref:Presequence protease, mitochondrial n=1 Tax=Coemansia interrupta TaxID=1126814 RepID=A0A9W8LNH8_9FUNG|nr:Mitochondrial presequence protease [Coemansia interrupta]